VPPYQPFPAQSARIPTSHSQIHLDGHANHHGSPVQSARHDRATTITSSPHLGGGNREPTWPLEGFSDLHLSGSEPRIFPGLVSGRARRGSQRQSSISENDEGGMGAWTGSAKGRSVAGGDREGAVEEEGVESDAGSN
jgi:AMP deaminase